VFSHALINSFEDTFLPAYSAQEPADGKFAMEIDRFGGLSAIGANAFQAD